jgi:hypothetical protein
MMNLIIWADGPKSVKKRDYILHNELAFNLIQFEFSGGNDSRGTNKSQNFFLNGIRLEAKISHFLGDERRRFSGNFSILF